MPVLGLGGGLEVIPGKGCGIGPVGTVHAAVGDVFGMPGTGGSAAGLFGTRGFAAFGLGAPGVAGVRLDGGAAPRPTSGSLTGRGASAGLAPAGTTICSNRRLVSLMR